MATLRKKLALAAAVGVAILAVGASRGRNSRLSPFFYYDYCRLCNPRTVVVGGDKVVIQPFGRTILRDAGGGTSFDVIVDPGKELSGGVFLRPETGATSRMLVSFESPDAHNVFVKFGRDGKYRYKVAGQNNTVLLDREFTNEIFVYLESPGQFRLSAIKLLLCENETLPACRNDNDLVREVKSTKDFPADAGMFEMARYLLNWGANIADYDMGKTLQKRAGEIFPGATAAEIYYQYYVPNLAGGYCGSLALFQFKLFQAFGLDAFTVNFGILNPDMTHVSVVVREPSTGRFFLMDPTFNGYYVDASTRSPLDIEALLTVARERIAFEDRPLSSRDFLALATEAPEESGIGGIRDCKKIASLDGRDVVLCRRDDTRITQFWKGRTLEAAKKSGITPDEYGFVDLMKRGFFSVGDGLTANARTDFIELLKKHGIPLAGAPSSIKSPPKT